MHGRKGQKYLTTFNCRNAIRVERLNTNHTEVLIGSLRNLQYCIWRLQTKTRASHTFSLVLHRMKTKSGKQSKKAFMNIWPGSASENTQSLCLILDKSWRYFCWSLRNKIARCSPQNHGKPGTEEQFYLIPRTIDFSNLTIIRTRSRCFTAILTSKISHSGLLKLILVSLGGCETKIQLYCIFLI